MLGRALKPNFEALRDAAKQLLIWSRINKAEFCTLFEDDSSSSKNRVPRRRNEYFEDDEFYSSKNRVPRRRDEYFEDDEFYSNKRRNTSFYQRSRGPFFDKDRDYNRNFRDRSSFRSINLLNEDISFNENLKPVVTDFYQPHPDVLSRSKEEINEFQKTHDIQVFVGNREKCPPPILNFNELELPSEAFDVIRELNYTTPTPVQSQTWPIILSGHNMVGISRTGSGKTLGFVLPALLHIKHQSALEHGEGPIALIVAPTRELVQQILNVIIPFAKKLHMRVAPLFGGAGKQYQVQHLLRGAELCVATPGRLNDVLSDSYVKLDRCTYLVLDEADRLLDMGFHPQIKSIFHYCRPDRQVSMWSATWPKEVKFLAENFLKHYIAVRFGSAELTANPNITQFIHVCEEREKFGLLKDILRKIIEEEDNKTLIFANTKLKVDHIGHWLRRERFDYAVIHGDKSQRFRDQALNSFRTGRKKILVGTEVVGRGIDIRDIRYVINYDFPIDIEGYVHIIGRTARSDNPGTSHTFFTLNDRAKVNDLIKILKQCKQEINPRLEEMVQNRHRVYSRYQKSW